MPLLTQQYVLASIPQPLSPSGPPFPPVPWPGLHVTYVEVSRVPGGGIEPDMVPAPKLTYHDAVRSLVFVGDQLQVTEIATGANGPPLGRLITVELSRSVDTGASFFSVLLPSEVATAGAVDHVSTVGITSNVAGPDSPIKRTTWQTSSLWGTFSATETGGTAA